MSICTLCLLESEKMPACRSCSIPYCSKECQKLDWKRHKQECVGVECNKKKIVPSPELSRARAQLQIWFDHKEKIGAFTLLANLLFSQDAYKSYYLEVTVEHNGKYHFYVPESKANVKHLMLMTEKHPDFFQIVCQHFNKGKKEEDGEEAKTDIFLLMECNLGNDLPSQTMMTTVRAHPVNACHAEAMSFYQKYPNRLVQKFNRNQELVDFREKRKKREKEVAIQDPFFIDFKLFLGKLAFPWRYSPKS